MTDDPDNLARHPAYPVVAAAIRFLRAHRDGQPSLAEVAAHVGFGESHLQRLFSTWAGVSPKQYLQFLTREDAKRRLREGSVLAAAQGAGLSGGGRLHDLLVRWEGMTPGDIRRRGAGVSIRYGTHPSPFGSCLIAVTDRGLCKLAFFDSDDQRACLEAELRADWAAATITRDDAATAALLPQVFPCDGQAHEALRRPLRLLLRGSPFQIQVWEALLAIPAGDICSYQDVAQRIGRPSATRAVASAIARNEIGFLIPCHRVIRSDGAFSHYRWGDTRKQAMIAWEAAGAMR